MTTAAIHLLNQGFDLSLHPNGELCKARGGHHISPAFHCKEIQKIATFLKNQLLLADTESRPSTIELADIFIQRYKKDPLSETIVRVFDRQVAPYREKLDYLEPTNKKNFNKWQKAGQSSEIFRDFPEFTAFLEESRLLSQIKVTRDTAQVINGTPSLLIEGQWVNESDLLKRFEVVKSKMYDSIFVVEKETREVFTYLDNGKGLQKHHPFLSAKTPISTLSEEDRLKTWNKSLFFVRPEEANLSEEERMDKNKNRTFVLQYVTSRTHKGDSNFDQLIRNPRHPYLRLIIGEDNPELNTKKGEVYEAGYGWKEAPILPFLTTQGRFRSPDPWEYKASEKIVTNIPITQEEAHKFYQFTLKYHTDGVNLGHDPGFHLLQQNCSVYTKEACKAAGISIPIEITIKDTFKRILPERIQEIGRTVQSWGDASSSWLHKAKERFVPQKVGNAILFIGQKIGSTMRKVSDIFISFIFIPIRAFCGEAFGSKGAAFRQLDKPEEEITPPLRNWRTWFSLSHYKLNLPGVAQEWQLKQPSTVVYAENDAIKLTIVPL